MTIDRRKQIALREEIDEQAAKIAELKMAGKNTDGAEIFFDYLVKMLRGETLKNAQEKRRNNRVNMELLKKHIELLNTKGTQTNKEGFFVI